MIMSIKHSVESLARGERSVAHNHNCFTLPGLPFQPPGAAQSSGITFPRPCIGTSQALCLQGQTSGLVSPGVLRRFKPLFKTVLSSGQYDPVLRCCSCQSGEGRRGPGGPGLR